MSSDSSNATVPLNPAALVKKNIHFTAVTWSKLEDGTQYGRANIVYNNPSVDGKPQQQPLIVKGGPMATYGVSDNKDAKTKEVTGHSVCLVAPKGGSAFENAVALIHEAACEYLVTNRDGCGQSMVVSMDIAKAFLKNPLGHPQKTVDNKKITDTSKPKRLYAKLVEYKASENRPAKMVTVFDDATSWNPETRKMERQIDPLAVRSNVEMIPSVHFDSIYFGSKPSMQVKLPRAAITRELGGNTVQACDSDVGEYMMAMGLATGSAASIGTGEVVAAGGSPSGGAAAAVSADPGTLL
jgi:hypothetical protein